MGEVHWSHKLRGLRQDCYNNPVEKKRDEQYLTCAFGGTTLWWIDDRWPEWILVILKQSSVEWIMDDVCKIFMTRELILHTCPDALANENACLLLSKDLRGAERRKGSAYLHDALPSVVEVYTKHVFSTDLTFLRAK